MCVCGIANLLTYVETQFNKAIKVIKIDNATEFVNLVCTHMFQRKRDYTSKYLSLHSSPK